MVFNYYWCQSGLSLKGDDLIKHTDIIDLVSRETKHFSLTFVTSTCIPIIQTGTSRRDCSRKQNRSVLALRLKVERLTTF